MSIGLKAMGLNGPRIVKLLGHGQLRPACETDAAGILAIYNETIAGGRTSPSQSECGLEAMQALIRWHQHSGWPMWAFLQDDGTVVAWVELRPFSWGAAACADTAEAMIYISQPWCGRGLGVHMGQLIISLALRHGARNLTAWILSENYASARLVRAFGFKHWGCLPALAQTPCGPADVNVYGASMESLCAGRLGRRVVARMREAQQPAMLAAA